MSRSSSTATRSLTFRYMLALVAIGITCLASQLVIQSLLANAESHSHVVNIAGRQRMLSQRIAKVSHQLAIDEGDDAAALSHELATSVKEFRQAGSLLRSDSHEGLQVLANSEASVQLESLQPQLETLADAASQIAAITERGDRNQSNLTSLLEQIDESERLFLAGMDQVVATIAEQSSNHIRQLIRTEKLITLCTLLLLLLEAVFVFRPAVRRISDAIQSLRLALSQARHERQNAENAIAERNLALTAAATDLKRLSSEIDSLLIDQMSVGEKSDGPRFRMLMTHVQSTLGKLTNLTDGKGNADNQLLVSRTSPRNLVKDAVHRFRSLLEEEVNVQITMDDRLPASLLVDEQLFRDSIIYLLQSVFDTAGPEVSVHVGYDDRELRLVVNICGQSASASSSDHALSSEDLNVNGPSTRSDIESLDLLLAKRTLERLGGELEQNDHGDRITILLPLDENKRMNLFVDRNEFLIA